jgi:exosortase D (VPLPA-CTERM-specific)
MNSSSISTLTSQRWTLPALGLFGLALVAIVFAFDDAIAFMVRSWRSPEFIHGPLILLAVAVMLWRRRELLREGATEGSWAGVVLCVLGAALAVAGQLASLFVVTQYGALACVYGVVLAAVGTRTLLQLWAPMLLLFFIVPPPQFVLINVIAQLQAASAQIAVVLLRTAGVSVFFERDVLDFGRYELRLDDVGAGLRLLIPLVVAAFAIGYLLLRAWWLRALLFASSVPLVVVVNGFVFAVVGIVADRSGAGTSASFVRDSLGWIVFAVSGLLLALAALALRQMDSGRRSQADPRFQAVTRRRRVSRGLPASLLAATALLLVTAVLSPWLVGRTQVVPQRLSFAGFPMTLGAWSGERHLLEDVYLDVLRLDDYLLADYRRPAILPVNFYIAWYDTQRAGRSAHSPRACLPGDGWQIQEFGQVVLPGAANSATTLQMNRALIARGRERQLVYYWFQQRGRNVTNEYLVKWYLLWDLLTRRRSDGALVRLTLRLPDGQPAEAADRQLQAFASEVAPVLEPYLPR